MKKIIIPLFFIIIISGLILCGCSNQTSAITKTVTAPATPEIIKWKIQSNMPRASIIFTDVIEPFTKLLKEMSDGRLEITPYAEGEIVAGEAMFDAVTSGMVDMISHSPSWIGGIIPEAYFEGGLAMSWMSLSEAYAILYNYGGAEILREAYAEQNVAWIAPQPNIGTRFWATKPVCNVNELKGLRVWNSGLKLFEYFDAIPSYLPFPEIFTALSTGGLDAVQIGATAYMDLGFYELCPYYMNVPVLEPYMSNFLANMDAWNKLSDDLKNMVTTAALKVGQDCYVTQTESEQLKMFDKIKNEWGHTIITWPESEITKLRQAAESEFEKHADKNNRCAQQVQILKDFWALKGIK